MANSSHGPTSSSSWRAFIESIHRSRLSTRFGRNLKNARVVCLDIPDEYEFMQPELVTLLELKVGRYLPA